MVAVGNRLLFDDLGIHKLKSGTFGAGTEIYVARNGSYLGSLLIADRVRASALPAVKALHKMNIGVVVITGDTNAAAESLADRLGILKSYSELLPEQKAEIVRREVRRGRTVAMLGDGINDASALAEATVGIAMGGGTDVARESADVVLIGNDLEKFVEAVHIARSCRRIILENFYGTLIVDTIGIGLAAAGLLNPLFAAFIHVASELTFILNSTRLLAPRQKVTAAAVHATVAQTEP